MKIGWIGTGKMARIVLVQVHQAMPSVEPLVVGRQYELSVQLCLNTEL